MLGKITPSYVISTVSPIFGEFSSSSSSISSLEQTIKENDKREKIVFGSLKN